MAIKVYKRNAAGRRNMSVVKADQITQQKPEKSLLTKLSKNTGRSHGKISVRHKGGAHKRRYRRIDFGQEKLGVRGKITAIERDPNRSALIALVQYQDGHKNYVIATEGMRVGKEIIAKDNAPIEEGNRMHLGEIPTGTTVSNIELKPGKGGQIVRSAGSSATVMGGDEAMVHVKLASGEVRLMHKECFATVGQMSNFEHNAVNIGKAGRNRHRGVRPTVRGSAMNPVHHPHGGGEGRQPIGLKHPKTPWGKPALGLKPRKRKKQSSRYIVGRRKK